jgi:hypothetical protein
VDVLPVIKRALQSFFFAIGRLFAPVLRLYGWCVPFRFGPIRNAVLLPDSMAVLMAMVSGICIWPIFGLAFPQSLLVALVLIPGVLLMLVRVKDGEVSVLRLVGFIPYWRHRIPGEAKFSLYEAWEDPAPTGVAFEARSYRTPLHLGTTRSARTLFERVGNLLATAGWKKATLGYEHPGNDLNRGNA